MAEHNMFTGRGKDLVPVTLEGEELEEALEEGWVKQDDENGVDRIYILRKMGYGTKQKLVGYASKMQVDQKKLQAAAAQMRAEERQGAAAGARANGNGAGPGPGPLPPGVYQEPGEVAVSERESEGEVLSETGQALAGMDTGFDIGAYNIEQLCINVRSWAGPSFVGVPCTRENILDLDPDNPLVVKTVQEIVKRNKRNKAQPSPKS